ncbi:lactoylglutathione lyase [Ferrovibrio sp.]|uniref:lactoylglutathione lyase n=1 Tax=Ferrovibrio sp. TaxID=1917215 RepID=UPI00262F1CEB|nr:lactoylglutathione lyase [Ferrovibrio sp.]
MSQTAAADKPAPAPRTAPFRMLHTMLRVFDLEKSLDFYVNQMGMKLLRRQDYPGGEFTLAFVGYGEEKDHAVIELTHNWGQKEPYTIGSGYGHIAIGVPDIYGLCEKLQAAGVKVPRPPGPMKHGSRVAQPANQDSSRSALHLAA